MIGFQDSDWFVWVGRVSKHEVVGEESEDSNFGKEEEGNQQKCWQVCAGGFRKFFPFGTFS